MSIKSEKYFLLLLCCSCVILIQMFISILTTIGTPYIMLVFIIAIVIEIGSHIVVIVHRDFSYAICFDEMK